MPVTHVLSVDLIPPDAIASLKLREAIDELCRRNETLGVSTGPINQIVLHGVGEWQLDSMVDYLKRGMGLDFEVGAPQVHYLESITKTLEWDYTYKKQHGGAGEYAKVKIRFEPGAPGSGFAFQNAAPEGAVPPRFVAAVEKGLMSAKETGTVAGFPVLDLICTLVDGGHHDVDSSERTFDIAARACFREAMPRAGPKILEPVMYVLVLTPPEHMGDVIADLNTRRGAVQRMDEHGDMQEIAALVPFANLLGYQHTLLSMTRGSAQHMMTFDHYESVPPMRGRDDDTFPPAVGMRA